MLVTARLMNEEDIACLRTQPGNETICVDTECISLSTAGFDYLPPKAQQALKDGAEIHLKMFGRLYLAAMNYAFAMGDPSRACRAIEESLKLLNDRLDEMAKPT